MRSRAISSRSARPTRQPSRSAATCGDPGKVVYQNEIFQLIQYAPTTDKVREVPLLIVPPWINKYYILDLTPAKSLIKFLVDQGFTVFVISWVNPDGASPTSPSRTTCRRACSTAADAVKRETGVDKSTSSATASAARCSATTLAYLAARGEDPFRSATFLTTQVDFSKAGDLLLFTDDNQLDCAGRDDGRARLSRRLAHGERVQHDAAAAT